MWSPGWLVAMTFTYSTPPPEPVEETPVVVQVGEGEPAHFDFFFTTDPDPLAAEEYVTRDEALEQVADTCEEWAEPGHGSWAGDPEHETRMDAFCAGTVPGEWVP